jgi:hypothetical protein
MKIYRYGALDIFQSVLMKRGQWNRMLLAICLRDIARGLQAMHEFDLVHYDLKVL